MTDIIIAGAGVHGQTIADVFLDAGAPLRGFLDDAVPVGTRVLGIEVIGTFEFLGKSDFLKSHRFIVGIGNSQNGRRQWSEHILTNGGELATAIHPSSVISRFAAIGRGAVIKQNVSICNDASIGEFSFIDCNSCIAHHVEIGTNVFVAAGCQFGGSAKVGEDSFLGAGTVVGPGVTIGDRTVIGLNSTVARDVPAETLVVGANAKSVTRGTEKLMENLYWERSGQEAEVPDKLNQS